MRSGLVAVAISSVLVLAGCAVAPDPEPTVVPTTPVVPSPTGTAGPRGLFWWEPVDSGPREGAMGPTTVDHRGVPRTYTVVEGDSADLIRLRFDIWWDSLADEDGTRMVKYPTLYVGDVLTFVFSQVAPEGPGGSSPGR